MTSFIAAAILLPASWLISWAFAAISATVSRTSAPRCPGLLRGGIGGTAGAAGVSPGAFASVDKGLSGIGHLLDDWCVRASAGLIDARAGSGYYPAGIASVRFSTAVSICLFVIYARRYCNADTMGGAATF
jgi:hypothetical protein